MKIIADGKACYGCRMCELACSFHYERAFAPEKSSIKVSRDNLSGEIGLTVDSTCDFCKGEKGPLCIEYCVYQVLKVARDGEE